MTLIVAVKTECDRVVVGGDGRISAEGRIVADDEVKIIKFADYIIGLSGANEASQIVTTHKKEIQNILLNKNFPTDERKLSQLTYYIKKTTKKYTGENCEAEVLLATPRKILATDIYGSIGKHLRYNMIGAGGDVAQNILDWDIGVHKKTFARIIDAKEYLQKVFEYVKTKDTTVGGKVTFKIV